MRQVVNLVRDACRGPSDRLNVLLFLTAPAFDVRLCRARPKDAFWVPFVPGEPGWPRDDYVLPPNLVLTGEAEPPDRVAFDLVVAPFRPSAVAPARAYSARLQVPLVHLVVDPPEPGLSPGRIKALTARLGHRAVVPDDKTAIAWGLTDYLKARNWTEPALAGLFPKVVGGPYQMKWGFDG